MSQNVPFTQRFGTGLPARPLDSEVPNTARIGLIGILNKIIKHNYVSSWSVLAEEVLHTGRQLRQDFPETRDEDLCTVVVKELKWDKFYIFCEKVYRVLQIPQYWDYELEDFIVTGTLEEAQNYYTDEINELLAEENLAYEFANGIFHRRGRPQTQKSLQRVSAVLSDPHYSQARNHYNKAVKFYNERPSPDIQNCVKEAICALEAFAEILFGKKAAKNFDEAIRSKQGNTEGQIPPTIGESIIKLRAFRGNAQGVAHAALEGGHVSEVEAELVLSLVASYITYLHDRFPSKEDNIPF
ncbi:MAG: hypothetical protein KJ077_49690 [Anaerolineae bacterium]|nr:hypothetical protein [Anaerolineae bacterium]